MKIFILILLGGSTMLLNAQTTFNFTSNATFSNSSGTEMNFLETETGTSNNGAPYTINIQDGVTLTVSNTDFDLTTLSGDVTVNILGTDSSPNGGGALLLSGGNGEITINTGDKIIVDPANLDGIAGSGGGLLRIDTDGTDYNNSDLATVVAAGGVEGSGALLPVQYAYFRGKSDNNRILLTWETNAEINNDYFEIEESFNGLDFESVGRVWGQGTTFIPTQYQFEIKNPASGIRYFRLKQTDFDGVFSYSKTVSVEIPGVDFFNIRNEFGKIVVQFSNSHEEGLNLFISDYSGRLLFDIENQFFDRSFEMNFSHFPTGIYYISVENRTLRQTKSLFIGR